MLKLTKKQIIPMIMVVGVIGMVAGLTMFKKQISNKDSPSLISQTSKSANKKNTSNSEKSGKNKGDLNLGTVDSPKTKKGTASKNAASSSSEAQGDTTSKGSNTTTLSDGKSIVTTTDAAPNDTGSNVPVDHDTTTQGYTADSIKEQSTQLDENPDYIKGSGKLTSFDTLKFGTNGFFIGGKNILVWVTNVDNPDEMKRQNQAFILNDPVDWALFRGQVKLSDDEYNKLVKYFNTINKYLIDNDIQITGIGG